MFLPATPLSSPEVQMRSAQGLSRLLSVLLSLVVLILLFAGAVQAQIPGCPLKQADRTVTICRPVAAVVYNSPVRVVAGAFDSQPVSRLEIWLDGAKVFQQAGSTLDTNVIVTAGKHRLSVLAVDPIGTFQDTLYVTVEHRLYPTFAYVANGSDGTTSGFAIEADSGFLRHNGYVVSRNAATNVAETWRGFVFVAGGTSGQLFAYRRTPDGRLLAVPGSPYNCCDDARGVAVDAAGKFVFVTDATAQALFVYAIDPVTGELTHARDAGMFTGFLPVAVAVNSRGVVAVANESSPSISVFRLDSTSGALGPVPGSPFVSGPGPHAIVADPFGYFFYVADYASNTVTAYNVALDGALTQMRGSPFAAGTGPRSLAMYPSGAFLFVANMLENTVAAYRIGLNGRLALVGKYRTAAQPSSVAVDPAGKYLLVGNSQAPYEVWTFRINATSGALTYVRRTRTRGSALSVAVSSTEAPLRFKPGFVYVGTADSSLKSGKVFGFTIGSAGALVPLAGSPYPHATGAIALAAHPSGKILYAPGLEPAPYQGLVAQYAVNLTTGTLTNVGAYTQQPEMQSPNMVAESSGRFVYGTSPAYEGREQGFWGWSLATDLTLGNWLWYGGDVLQPYIYLEPTGRFAYLADSVAKINITTGDLWQSTYDGHPFDHMVADPTGRFVYSTSSGSNQVRAFSVGWTTGRLTAIGSALSTGALPQAIAIEPHGRFVYVANKAAGTISAYAANVSSGVLTSMGTFAAGPTPVALTTDGTGKYLLVANEASLQVRAFQIDPSTGKLTLAQGSPVRLYTTGRATAIVNISPIR
jgi:6-phosphogluconolactonase (cycloisomerase 2 family)